jgi:RNA polymerase sigma-70 factor (ECF subfamily)
MSELRPDSAETCGLLERVAQGEQEALGSLLDRHRPDLKAFVEARLDPRLAARLDPSDVVQEAQLVIARRIDEFLERRPMPFHVWMRRTAYERLVDLRRHHLKRARRSVSREVPLPERSSLLLARPLLAGSSTPSRRLEAQELAERISRAVAELAEADREVLLMRHAEALPFEEIACLLAIEPAAARKRFGRALIRLQKALSKYGLLE